MSDAKTEIQEGLHALVKLWTNSDSNTAFSAEVLSVDMSTRSCSVRSISSKVETEYPTVWLMPEIADGILYKPKVGSTVIVENNANLQPYVSMWSEIDGVYLVVGNTTFSMTDGLTQFNDGTYGGLAKVKDPADTNAGLLKRLNLIENDINALKNIFNSWVVVPNDGGGALFLLLATYKTSLLASTTEAEISNAKITHGK